MIVTMTEVQMRADSACCSRCRRKKERLRPHLSSGAVLVPRFRASSSRASRGLPEDRLVAPCIMTGRGSSSASVSVHRDSSGRSADQNKCFTSRGRRTCDAELHDQCQGHADVRRCDAGT